jgi:hypothetical protein
MCTLLTVSADKYNRALESHIRRDARNNPDGFACLLLDANGHHTIVRSMSIETILTMLRNAPWERMFLHSRYATQGEVRLDNTHGWAEQGTFYMHNGCLQSRDADVYEVDSQAIGGWLIAGGMEYALQQLRSEQFANVFMVDLISGYYAVTKSAYGSLFTDGRGNYATNPIGDIAVPAVPGSVDFWWYSESDPEALADESYVIDDDGLDGTDLPPPVDMEIESLEQWREHMNADDDGMGDYVSPSLRRRA